MATVSKLSFNFEKMSQNYLCICNSSILRSNKIQNITQGKSTQIQEIVSTNALLLDSDLGAVTSIFDLAIESMVLDSFLSMKRPQCVH